MQRAAAAQTPHRCQIFDSLEALRWALDEPVLYALASKFWAAGVDGTPLPLAININNQFMFIGCGFMASP